MRMTDERAARPISKNLAAMSMLILGVVGLLLGPVLWNMGSQQLSREQYVAAYTQVTSPAIGADQALVVVGIGVLALGVLLLVAFVASVAVRRQ